MGRTPSVGYARRGYAEAGLQRGGVYKRIWGALDSMLSPDSDGPDGTAVRDLRQLIFDGRTTSQESAAAFTEDPLRVLRYRNGSKFALWEREPNSQHYDCAPLLPLGVPPPQVPAPTQKPAEPTADSAAVAAAMAKVMRAHHASAAEEDGNPARRAVWCCCDCFVLS